MRPLTAAELKLVQANGDFWLDMFKAIDKSEQDKNIFVSPLSISMALGMTMNGANGTTLDSMKNVLRFSNLSMSEINEAYKSLIALLSTVDPNVQLNIANSIWYRTGFPVERDFIDVNKTYFDALVSDLDFNNPSSCDVINSWVNAETSGKINKILDGPIPPELMMYLINALYFKGDWTFKFKKELTKDDQFTLQNGSKVSCQMMSQESRFALYTGDSFSALDLPYGGQVFSMTVILPKADIDINTMMDSFSLTAWRDVLNGLQSTGVVVLLPKFKLEYETSLIPPLRAMGMGNAFDGRADFTRICKSIPLCIGEARHKTYVKVDEEGTEAAAVTIIGIKTTSAGPIFRADRPFLFVIRERSSGAVLFVGKILNPNG
jgi:serpin B